MNAPTCQDFRVELELYAAGECDPETAALVERHLAACAACTQALADAQQLLDLLDVRFQEPERIQRLQEHVRAELGRKVPARRVLPFVRWAAAAAALVLVAVGLAYLLRRGGEPELNFGPNLELAAVLKAPPVVLSLPTRGGDKAPGKIEPAAKELPKFFLDLRGQTPEQLRKQLLAPQGTRAQPRPPDIELSVELRNPGDQPVTLWLGGPPAEVLYELHGPGAVVVEALESVPKPAEGPGLVTLEPGASHRLMIRRLEYVRAGKTWRAYWTEPGEYTLTVHLTTAVTPAPKGAKQVAVPGDSNGRKFGEVTLTSAPIHFNVQVRGERK